MFTSDITAPVKSFFFTICAFLILAIPKSFRASARISQKFRKTVKDTVQRSIRLVP